MKPHINMLGIITNNIQIMKQFYSEVLGFEVLIEMDDYVEFKNDGVRFALSTTSVMKKITADSSYDQEKKGQSLELAFKVDTEAEVDSTIKALLEKGAHIIMEPKTMEWGQRAAFFADPDGNIHEVFCDL